MIGWFTTQVTQDKFITFEPITFTISITSLVIGIGISIWAIFNHYTQKRIEHNFNQRLEEQRSQLQIQLESKKFDFQRMGYDFNLYRTKRHEVYPEMYKLMMIAIHELKVVVHQWSFPQFGTFTKEGLCSYLETRSVREEKIKELTSNWGSVSLIEEHFIYEIKMAEWNRLRQKFIDANEFFWSTEIYLSEAVTKCGRLLIASGDLIFQGLAWDILERSYNLNVENLKDRPDIDSSQLYKIILEKGDEIKALIKKELSIADYNLD